MGAHPASADRVYHPACAENIPKVISQKVNFLGTLGASENTAWQRCCCEEKLRAAADVSQVAGFPSALYTAMGMRWATTRCGCWRDITGMTSFHPR